MAIEIVDLPIAHGHFPVRYVNVYQAGYFSTSHIFCYLPVVKHFQAGKSPTFLV